MDLRQVILKRLKEVGWTKYRLAESLHDQMGMQTIYSYLSGRNGMISENLESVLAILGLGIMPIDDAQTVSERRGLVGGLTAPENAREKAQKTTRKRAKSAAASKR